MCKFYALSFVFYSLSAHLEYIVYDSKTNVLRGVECSARTRLYGIILNKIERRKK